MHPTPRQTNVAASWPLLALLAFTLMPASHSAEARRATASVPPDRCLPDRRDFCLLWWANGWEGGQPREPAHLCLQTGYYAAVFDPARATVVRLGPIPRGRSMDYLEAATVEPDTLDRLPESALELSVRVGGTTYRCVQAATRRTDWMNFPVRLVEGGRFFQRFDLLQLVFEDDAGRRLPADGRLEVAAWPDQLHFLLELVPTAPLAHVALQLRLLDPERPSTSDASGDAGESNPTPGDAPAGRTLTAHLRWSPDPGRRSRDSRSPIEVRVTEVAAVAAVAAAVPVSFDPRRGWHRVVLPRRRWSVAEEPDRFERFRVQVSNPDREERVVRLCFEDDSGTPGITGVTALWRDAEGNPSGIPVQVSKNWHRQEQRRMLYEGPWMRAFTWLRVPPGRTVEGEFDLAWARWGGVPAASHAQLCLIGWGWNQLWEQAAIGSWGETICFEPDAIQQRCRIDDLRPLMVWGMGDGRRKWTWTHNVGGGDFLVYHDEHDRYQPWRAVRTAYLSQGPNLTDVSYAGITADDRIACRVRVSLPRCDDLTRVYLRFRYDVRRPTPFRRLAFLQVGSDRYHWHQYRRLGRGDADGLIEEWEPGGGGKRYLRTGIPCSGDQPWFSLHDAIPADGGKPIHGAWATRGLVLRSWSARLGGKVAAPFASVFGTEAGSIPGANLELSPPPGLDTLLPGDFVEGLAELLVLPMSAEDYYGPNENLRAALRDGANTWRGVHRQAAGNRLRLVARVGRWVDASPLAPASRRETTFRSYPPTIEVGRGETAEFEVTGGVGYVPVTFVGLKSPRGHRLVVADADGEREVDQSVHGRDFWQATHRPERDDWTLTYNLPLDTPGDRPITRRIMLQPTTGSPH